MTTWWVDLGGALGMLSLLYWAIRGVLGERKQRKTKTRQNTEMIKLVRQLLRFFYQRQLGRKKVLPRWAVYDGRNWSWISNELGGIVARLGEMSKPNQWRCESCGTVNSGKDPQKCKRCGRPLPAPWE